MCRRDKFFGLVVAALGFGILIASVFPAGFIIFVLTILIIVLGLRMR